MTSKIIAPIGAFIFAVSGMHNADANETYTTHYNGTISGAVISSQIDAVDPGDGVNGILASFAVTTRNLGLVTAQAVVEDVSAALPPGTCPEGTDLEFSLGSVRGVHRFANGDLLFLNGLTRAACVDFDTFTVSTYETGEFAGGTGQFADATGSWEIDGATYISVFDPAGQLFGPFSGELIGTIVTPKQLTFKRR